MLDSNREAKMGIPVPVVEVGSWRQVGCVFATVLLLTQGLFGAEQKQLSLRWSELEPAVAGGKVKIVLPNGPRIEGRVVAVEPEALRINITKTSDKKLQPKGETSIPRTAVSVMQVVSYGVGWRIAGAAIGPILVAAAAAGAAGLGVGTDYLPAYIGFGAPAVLGTAIGGYYLGKRADRHVTTIRIVQQSR